MSTIVYQGTLQSCFESQIIETTTLKLKVPSTIEFSRGPCMIENNLDNLKQHQITNKSSTTTNLDLGGGWNFLQNLSNNISSKDSNLEKENDTYVHPLSKRSSYSSRLSDKSLQLCTESLGSETGTDIIDTNIFSLSSSSSSYSPTSDNMMMTQPSPPPPSSSSTWTIKIRTNTNKKCWSKFPPPLTTIRGLNSMQIRPHREDGRLIIKAIEAPLTHNYLQAERSNGRLRLCFFKDDISTTTSASNYEESKENEELEVSEDDIIQSEIIEEEEEEEEEEEIEENKDDTEEEVEEESDMYNNMKWDMDRNKFDVEGEMGKEKCQKLSRCKESGQGNKVFCDWRKPLWVATS